MTTFDRITMLIIRITGVFQVLLGIAFWTAHLQQLIPLHMLVGAVFVISLWIVGFRSVPRGGGALAGVVIGWGAFAIAFGMVQQQILPGPYHWIIRVLHLAVGIAAMAMADRLSRRMGFKPGRPAVLDARPA